MNAIILARLTEVEPSEIARHMSDPLVAKRMPLLTSGWDTETARGFVLKKGRILGARQSRRLGVFTPWPIRRLGRVSKRGTRLGFRIGLEIW